MPRSPAGDGGAIHVVGLVSDTHGLVRPGIAAALSGVELILHAGDVGGSGVLERLSEIAPVQAVYGNVDDPHDPALARERSLCVGDLSIHVSHGHELGVPTAERVLACYSADIVVFGHTHRSTIWTPPLPDGIGRKRSGRPRMAINPGAAGPRRFDVKPSVAKLTIAAGRAEVEIIELA